MSNPPPTGGTPDDTHRLPPEAALGGADAVPDTSYVTQAQPLRPKGDARAHPHPPAATTVPNATLAIIIFLAVAAVLVYLLGLGR